MRINVILPSAVAIFGMVLSIPVQAGCVSTQDLQRLLQAERVYMLGRIPPAFRHALEDGRITMQMHAEDGSDSDTCQVRLEMTLPQDEVAEAAAVLARDPAKRILLASQGYALPESGRIMALFPVDAATLAIPAEQSLQVAPLGKLRASIEMQYALLTQARADIPVNSRNSIAWRQEFRDTQLQLCQARLTGSKGNSSDCACWVDGLSAQVSERQMDYLDYLTTNPYAQATGASRNFELIEERIKQVCGLNKRS